MSIHTHEAASVSKRGAPQIAKSDTDRFPIGDFPTYRIATSAALLSLSLFPFVLLQVSPLAAIIIPWEFERHVTALLTVLGGRVGATWIAFL